MRAFRLPTATLLAALLLGGCQSATVSESQCIAGDWQTIGLRDGANGLPSTQLLEHQDACVRHGAFPNREAYLAGWNEGIVGYCQADNGFALGSRGGGYRNVCPPALAPAFVTAYEEGRALYRVRSDVISLERLIQRKEARLATVNRELLASGTAQLEEDLTTQERVELLAKSQRLMDERSELERELPELAEELRYKEGELNALQRALAVVDY